MTQARLLLEAEGESTSVMATMRRGDLLVHHPYDSFGTSVERFVTESVDDPDVLAIKQTVYRTSDSSPLVPALIRATEQGKQAVCMVELKARFDERTNIQWALSLEEAGVHVVYGIPGLKTHAKAILVLRREGDRVRHYVHIGTGNYNSKTARLYTDLGLFTTDPEIGADVADVFNFLTGFARPKSFRKLLVAPVTLRDGIIEQIRLTIAAHTPEQPTRILMKMNALVDAPVIRALYDASRAGVRVELNVRGICCLRPGIPGVSDNIRVVSNLGRFLEHSRVYFFERPGDERCYMGSADLMPRNLDHRVEILAPVEEPLLRGQVKDVLERCLADTSAAWELRSDGSWHRVRPAPGQERNAAAGAHGACASPHPGLHRPPHVLSRRGATPGSSCPGGSAGCVLARRRPQGLLHQRAHVQHQHGPAVPEIGGAGQAGMSLEPRRERLGDDVPLTVEGVHGDGQPLLGDPHQDREGPGHRHRGKAEQP